MSARFIVRPLWTAAAIMLVIVPLANAHAADARPNVLFIAVDDLNDWVGCLGGHPQAKTPNIDALAARGVNFTRAYCASPVCNPSRTALMVGLRSSTSGVYNNNINRRDSQAATSVPPLNTHFHAQGYYVAGAGKIYHGDGDQFGEWDEYANIKGRRPAGREGRSDGVGGIRFAPVDGADEDMHDYHTVNYCIEQLQKKHDKPFFLACGLHKPHMAWNVPRKYYDMFPLDSIELPKVLETDLDDVPAAGVRMARPEGDHAEMLKSGRWKEAVQGYLAAVAYCDAMIGRLMKAFDESAYKDNTIIVFWGDHGWHLGEKQHWRKFALWEEATRAPLFFVAPGVTKPNHQRADGRFHEHLSDALRLGRPADSPAHRRRQRGPAAQGSGGRVGPASSDDAWPREPRRPQRAVALHPLRRRQRRTVRPRRRPAGMEEPGRRCQPCRREGRPGQVAAEGERGRCSVEGRGKQGGEKGQEKSQSEQLR